jgi:hypothetical protein
MDDARRRYQQRVRALLVAIDGRQRRQLALAAGGATLMGTRDLERELRELRTELAAVIAAGSDALAAPVRLLGKHRDLALQAATAC